MKTLKKQLDELLLKFKQRIITGHFETVSITTGMMDGYIGSIVIKIDDVKFEFSLSEKSYICQHSDIKLPFGFYEEENLTKLYEAYYAKIDRSGEIKKLKDKIKQLQNEQNEH